MSVRKDKHEIVPRRICVDVEDFNRFKLGARKYDKQFSNIYNARLKELRKVLVYEAKKKWGNHEILSLSSLSDIENQGAEVIIIGTLYKFQELKPSILKELSEEVQTTSQPPTSNYSNHKDQIFLEDEILRVRLAGSHINSKEIVTGLVCAVLGHELDNGTFWVQDYCLPGMCPKASGSNLRCSKNTQILLISGLDLVNNTNSLEMELLTEWMSGIAGNNDVRQVGASICQVIIAGNSIRGEMEMQSRTGYSGAKDQHNAAVLQSTLATRKFDLFLSEVVGFCCVLLLPGQFDPSGHSIPQQAIHPTILPRSSRYKSLRRGTNPWIGKIGGRVVAGSSGQPIEDIMRAAGLNESQPLDWLERTLTWRHFAPTAPDTLPCYPYFNNDPFIMRECPDIYFVGNMEEYATKMIFGTEGQVVRLISVPKFSKTQKAVLVNLESLDTRPVTFAVN